MFAVTFKILIAVDGNVTKKAAFASFDAAMNVTIRNVICRVFAKTVLAKAFRLRSNVFAIDPKFVTPADIESIFSGLYHFSA